MIYLTDDGTLDTVFACGECGEEFRCNYAQDGDPFDQTGDDPADVQYRDYLAWVRETQAEIEDEHDCGTGW